MLTTDVAPSRLLAARSAAGRLVDAVPDDVRVGAIAFNHGVSILHSPTRDHAAVEQLLGGIDAAGSTATGDALQAALRMIEDARGNGQSPPPAAIVLLSDGKSERGSDPLQAAEKARQAGVPIHTVALGTRGGTIERRRRSGEVLTVPVPPDRETLRRIARRAGGESFATADGTRLDDVYERLGSQVARERRPREVTNLFAGGALLVMAGSAFAALRWFGRFV
jgi:Ca-activated chloride channel family protein